MIVVECDVDIAIFIVHCLEQRFNGKGRSKKTPSYCDHFEGNVDQYVYSSITGCDTRVFSEMLVRCPLYFSHGPLITDQTHRISHRVRITHRCRDVISGAFSPYPHQYPRRWEFKTSRIMGPKMTRERFQNFKALRVLADDYFSFWLRLWHRSGIVINVPEGEATRGKVLSSRW